MGRSKALAFVILNLGGVAGLLASCGSTPYPIDARKIGEYRWDEGCLIHRPCKGPFYDLPPCPRDIKTSILPVAAALPPGIEIPVRVAGRLQFGEGGVTMRGCGAGWAYQWDAPEHCCNKSWLETILVGERSPSFELPNLGCQGDESRVCCNVVAAGQRVVATGVMRLLTSGVERRWAFRGGVEICALPASAAKQ
jgi:hypothetical protein